MIDDLTLLRDFTRQRSEPAFRQLVDRHLDLVYRLALRRTAGDTHLAQDATQSVFCDLARKAAQLVDHPNLIAWLHTSTRYATSTLTRAMHRRQAHEIPLGQTVEPHIEGTPPEDLGEIVADLLTALPATDREAVLLRFIEDRSFAEIGAHLHTSEDAARMRTHRALEKLRNLLSVRGVTSTAAAISGALTLSAVSLPRQLTSATVSAHALQRCGATASGGSSLLATLTGAPVAWVLAIAAIALTWFNFAHPSPPAVPPASTVAAAPLTASPSSTNPLPLSDEPPPISASPAIREETPLTREAVQDRYNRGKAHAQAGRDAEALADFSWCFDVGMRRVPSFAGVRVSFLVNSLIDIAKRHPPARDFLETRRLDALAHFDDPLAREDSAADLAALNAALGRNDETLAIFLALPSDDPRARFLGSRIKPLLLEAQRYADAARVVTLEGITRFIEAQASITERIASLPASAQSIHRRSLVTSIAQDIEILAGSGHTDDAHDAIEMLYAYDHSPETVALLKTHLERAGASDLLAAPPLPPAGP